MTALLDKTTQYHRPMGDVAVNTIVARLRAAGATIYHRTFRFPLSQRSSKMLVAAINTADTSGLPPLTIKQLRDPWSQATIARLKKVLLP